MNPLVIIAPLIIISLLVWWLHSAFGLWAIPGGIILFLGLVALIVWLTGKGMGPPR